MNELTRNLKEIVVGDRIAVVDSTIPGATRTVLAAVVEIRRILGKQAFVVVTEQGQRRMVSASQIWRIESSK